MAVGKIDMLEAINQGRILLVDNTARRIAALDAKEEAGTISNNERYERYMNMCNLEGFFATAPEAY